MQIGANHPLRRFFVELARRRFYDDPKVAGYIGNLLTDFTHADNLYRIRNARGKRLAEVGEMLIESNPLFEARSFDYERAVRKHIGDYTLFLTGLFPEYVAAVRRRGTKLDSMLDYIRAGKESYHIVSCFDQFEYRDEAPLFRKLSASFEACVFGLNLVKGDIQQLQHDAYRRWQLELG